MDDNYRKKNVSDTNISSIESCQVACYSGKKYYNPVTNVWNIYYQKTSKIAILSSFL